MAAALKRRAERYQQGRDLRTRVPREAHAELHGPLDRDAVAILAESDAERVAELLPERYKLMTADPFAFLRGAAAVMATDLAHQPLAGVPVQACGDCHLMNFGAFNSPEDNILFDINDFDETLPGVDFTVDVKRLAASVAVAANAAAYVGQAGAQPRREHGDRLSRTYVRSYGAFSARNLAQQDRS